MEFVGDDGDGGGSESAESEDEQGWDEGEQSWDEGERGSFLDLSSMGVRGARLGHPATFSA